MFDDTDCTAVASDMARLTAAAEAAGLVAVARLALRRREEGSRRHLSQEECDSYTADEVGALLRLSRPAARGRLVLALDLLLHRPATLAALTRGAICAARARRISEALVVLDHAVAAGVEAEALRRAPEQTPAQLTARLTRLVLRADAEAAHRRTEAAVRERRCSIRVLHDGTALLQVLGRTAVVAAAYERIDTVARSLVGAEQTVRGKPGENVTGEGKGEGEGEGEAPAPGRRLDQTRSDVLLGLLLGDPDSISGAAGVSVTLDVVAPAGTMLGDQAPGELVGYGPVSAEVVRELGEDAAWRRWVTDADGTVLHRTSRRYRPSQAMVQLLRARDGTCRFPTCRRRASACDLDHVVPWPIGATCASNLVALCRHHHRLKHRGGWDVRQDADGTLRWRTPAGLEHVSRPRRLDDVIPTRLPATPSGTVRSGVPLPVTVPDPALDPPPF